MKTVNEITIPTNIRNLALIYQLISETLKSAHAPKDTESMIMLCAEELFVNICYYAYGGNEGEATLKAELDNGSEFYLTFIDGGQPFDPTERGEVDVEKTLSQDTEGGLGIHLVKSLCDGLTYEYKDRKNVLTLKKSLNDIAAVDN